MRKNVIDSYSRANALTFGLSQFFGSIAYTSLCLTEGDTVLYLTLQVPFVRAFTTVSVKLAVII